MPVMYVDFRCTGEVATGTSKTYPTTQHYPTVPGMTGACGILYVVWLVILATCVFIATSELSHQVCHHSCPRYTYLGWISLAFYCDIYIRIYSGCCVLFVWVMIRIPDLLYGIAFHCSSHDMSNMSALAPCHFTGKGSSIRSPHHLEEEL